MNILSLKERSEDTSVATIGFFDGCHCGHSFVLEKLREAGQKYDLLPMVVSFLNHPRLFFEPHSNFKLLSTPEEKLSLLSTKGVRNCLLLSFDETVKDMTSKAFMDLLAEQYGVRMLLVGYDHRFGCDRDTTFEELKSYGETMGVYVEQLPAFIPGSEKISSSAIRRALEQGDVELANRMLGYHYFVTGKVIAGKQNGRKIDFPTANLDIAPNKMVPKDGVYAVEVVIEGAFYSGLLNIGYRPTLSGKEKSVEVHILDFNGDLYGKNITIQFLYRLRDEQRFDSLDSLKEQIMRDKSALLERRLESHSSTL